MRKAEILFTALLVPIDFIMIVLSAFCAYWLRLSPYVASLRPVLFNIPPESYLGLAVVIAVVWIFIFTLAGLYKMKRRKGILEDFSKIVVASFAGLAVIVIYIFIKREWFDSRFLILGGWLFSVCLVVFGRLVLTIIQRFVVGKFGFGLHNVLMIGDDKVSQVISKELDADSTYGYSIKKVLSKVDMGDISSAVKEYKIDDIILANTDCEKDQASYLVDFCNERHIGFRFVPNLFQTFTSNVAVDTIAMYPLIELKRTSLDGWGKIIKRVVDVFGSLVGLLFLSPIFLLMAILIKGDSRGPVFVKLKRISRREQFNLYKFRSMINNAEGLKDSLMSFNERQEGPLFKMKNDPRVTKFGKILRRYRLDELPQLFNVLEGKMSLVGPRPHQPDEIAKYEKHHKQLLVIKPGMTGMAQISGSSDLSFEEEVRLDVYYIENWSHYLDFKILFKTILVIFKDKSAC